MSLADRACTGTETVRERQEELEEAGRRLLTRVAPASPAGELWWAAVIFGAWVGSIVLIASLFI